MIDPLRDIVAAGGFRAGVLFGVVASACVAAGPAVVEWLGRRPAMARIGATPGAQRLRRWARIPLGLRELGAAPGWGGVAFTLAALAGLATRRTLPETLVVGLLAVAAAAVLTARRPIAAVAVAALPGTALLAVSADRYHPPEWARPALVAVAAVGGALAASLDRTAGRRQGPAAAAEAPPAEAAARTDHDLDPVTPPSEIDGSEVSREIDEPGDPPVEGGVVGASVDEAVDPVVEGGIVGTPVDQVADPVVESGTVGASVDEAADPPAEGGVVLASVDEADDQVGESRTVGASVDQVADPVGEGGTVGASMDRAVDPVGESWVVGAPVDEADDPVGESEVVVHRRDLSLVLLAVSVFGAYATTPETEDMVVLLGAVLPVAVLACVRPPVALGRVGSLLAVALLSWTVVLDGAGRPGAIVGGLSCLGVLIVLPAVRRLPVGWRRSGLLPRRWWPFGQAIPAPALPTSLGPALPVLAVHVALVGVCSRIAGLRTSAGEALAIVAVAHVAAAGVLVWLRSRQPSPSS